MICRIATHQHVPGDLASDGARAFRDWIKQQPGFRAGYHVQDPGSGKTLSISFWESHESLMAMKDLTPPGGAVGLRPLSVEIFTVAEEF